LSNPSSAWEPTLEICRFLGSVQKVLQILSHVLGGRVAVGGPLRQPKDEDMSMSSTFKEEILEKEPGKRASKLKRTYQKAELTKKGNKIVPSFLGKEVLIDRSDAGTKFTMMVLHDWGESSLLELIAIFAGMQLLLEHAHDCERHFAGFGFRLCRLCDVAFGFLFHLERDLFLGGSGCSQQTNQQNRH
jgi:hypothetical protein